MITPEQSIKISSVNDAALQHMVRIAVGIITCIEDSHEHNKYDKVRALHIVLSQASESFGNAIEERLKETTCNN